MIEIKGEAMPVVTLPAIHTPPPQMDADDLMPLQGGLVLMDVTSDEQVQLTQEKLRDSLSFSHTGGSLSSELAKIKPDEDLLSKSCFSQIRLEKGGDDFEDEELTSLEWLQDSNLLKNINEKAGVCLSPPSSDDEGDYDSGKENDSLNSSFNSHGMSPLPHPSHIPYNPQKHVNSKPPYSFSCLIFMAIEESTDKKLPVKDIYTWILTNFPYFQNAPTGWKNSVRHNLSLNKCFQKVDKDKTSNIGKGSYWCIDPEYRPTLLQALRKTPYHPYHQLQMMSVSPLQMTPQKYPFVQRFGSGNKNISPHLFPFLSKRLNNPQSDTLDTDIDVAKALVSLKKSRSARHNSRYNHRLRSLNLKERRSRSPSPPEFGSREDKARTTNRSRRANSPIIVTEVPSTDHTYSSMSVPKGLMGSPGNSSIDGEYEFHDVEEGEGLLSGDEFDSEEEEEMSMEVDSGKEMEGVNALLDLASVATSAMSDLLPSSSPVDVTATTSQSQGAFGPENEVTPMKAA